MPEMRAAFSCRWLTMTFLPSASRTGAMMEGTFSREAEPDPASDVGLRASCPADRRAAAPSVGHRRGRCRRTPGLHLPDGRASPARRGPVAQQVTGHPQSSVDRCGGTRTRRRSALHRPLPQAPAGALQAIRASMFSTVRVPASGTPVRPSRARGSCATGRERLDSRPVGRSGDRLFGGRVRRISRNRRR